MNLGTSDGLRSHHALDPPLGAYCAYQILCFSCDDLEQIVKGKDADKLAPLAYDGSATYSGSPQFLKRLLDGGGGQGRRPHEGRSAHR